MEGVPSSTPAHQNCCATIELWQQVQGAVESIVDNTTLADLQQKEVLALRKPNTETNHAVLNF